MAEQKRFQKKTLNKDDHKAMENGTKVVKGILCAAGAIVLFVCNKDNLKVVGKGIVETGKIIINR